MQNESINQTYYEKFYERKKYYKHFKRCMDIIIALLGIILLSPIFLVISVLIMTTSKGAVFFKQRRVGQWGRLFDIYKFRTMYKNSEELMNQFSAEQLEEFMENYKLKNDPRVTSIGKYLRRTSLDELPQLFNILKGDMSIVGPRPVTTEELLKYGFKVGALLSVKPGLTGKWQVSGRSKTTYDERIRLDMEYIHNISLAQDFKIILKTFVVLFNFDEVY